jgi:outer membrane protein assembly factor BamE (lipoprotein component of BamABCDE complex)
MNQILLHHVELVVNEKYFQFAFVPGTINFDDIDAALAQFKVEFDKMKVAEEERVQKSKDDAAAEVAPVEAVPAEDAPLEPELVA